MRRLSRSQLEADANGTDNPRYKGSHPSLFDLHATSMSNATQSAHQTHHTSITLTNYLRFMQKVHGSDRQLGHVMDAVGQACKILTTLVQRAGLIGLHGFTGTVNVQAEDQKKLDAMSNSAFIHCLKECGAVRALASEEEDHIIIVENEDVDMVGEEDDTYGVVFDPLDGSSNLEVNIAVGSIFGIYKMPPKSEFITEADLLKPGREMVAAGYALYSSATMLMITLGHGVAGFHLDPLVGDWILVFDNLRIPEKGKTYSINEGNAATWTPDVARWVVDMKERKPPMSQRYIGSMVGDMHRTLLTGGVFMYPADKKSPNGKLRLLYECNPMSMLIEQAGGKSTTGKERVLDVQPTGAHQRVPIIIGSTKNVEEYEAIAAKLAEEGEQALKS